jgi:hypothetical protein
MRYAQSGNYKLFNPVCHVAQIKKRGYFLFSLLFSFSFIIVIIIITTTIIILIIRQTNQPVDLIPFF